jgi:hypothetical protein
MTGYVDFNYPEFNSVAGMLQGCGYATLNPADIDNLHPVQARYFCSTKKCGACAGCKEFALRDWKWYMRHALVMMLEADGIALLRGWSQSRGAKVEAFVGRAVGMEVMSWQSWMLRAKEGEEAPRGRRDRSTYEKSAKPRKKVGDL